MGTDAPVVGGPTMKPDNERIPLLGGKIDRFDHYSLDVASVFEVLLSISPRSKDNVFI